MRIITRDERGITVIELMMVVTIMAILLSIGVYNLLGDLPSYRLRQTASKIAGAVQFMKIRSVATNRIGWLDVNYNTADSNYFTVFIDEDGSGTASASEYDLATLDYPDNVGGVPCFVLPDGVSFGFGAGYVSGSPGPDGVSFPGAGNYINTPDPTGGYSGPGGDSKGGYLGYRPTGVPVHQPGDNLSASSISVIYLTNIKDEAFAVSVQITGRVKILRWNGSVWQ